MSTIIETERLILRNFRESDFEDFWELYKMPNVRPRGGSIPYNDKETALKAFKNAIQLPLRFAIELKEKQKVIGDIGLSNNNSDIKGLLAMLNENYWNQGIMTEALKVIVKYGFDYLNLKTVIGAYLEPNIASKKMHEKAELKEYERVKDKWKWYETGEIVDLVKMKITQEEYQKSDMYKEVKFKVTENENETL